MIGRGLQPLSSHPVSLSRRQRVLALYLTANSARLVYTVFMTRPVAGYKFDPNFAVNTKYSIESIFHCTRRSCAVKHPLSRNLCFVVILDAVERNYFKCAISKPQISAIFELYIGEA